MSVCVEVTLGSSLIVDLFDSSQDLDKQKAIHSQDETVANFGFGFEIMFVSITVGILDGSWNRVGRCCDVVSVADSAKASICL